MSLGHKILRSFVPKKKIGLALSGGAAHGIAHIGVLQAFYEEGFEPDMICGVSAGAIVGFLYASHIPPLEILEIAKNLHWKDLLSFRPNRFGLFDTQKTAKLLTKWSGDPDWEQLKYPFYPISFDYSSGKTVCPRNLRPADAVHASMSVPIVFQPFFYNQSALGDGGMTENVPSKYCKLMGADYIVAVNVIAGGLKHFREVKNLRDMINQLKQIMLGHTYRPFYEWEDVYIVPDLNRYSVANMKPVMWYYNQGYREAQKYLADIQTLAHLCK